MYRDDGEVSVSSTLFLGAFVLAKRFASSLSSFSVTASSMIVARSPSGTDERMRSRSRLSLSRSSSLAVNWTFHRAGAMGLTTAGVAGAGAGKDAGSFRLLGVLAQVPGADLLGPDRVGSPWACVLSSFRQLAHRRWNVRLR